ncbi:MAG: hypothetical protein M1835_008131 [Candelina submexicana]|nr:MAG: hypothetical protein M1835_008131 [Candelina submexicana]
MPQSWFKPKVAHLEKQLQLSYELPHRIHTAKVYPITSSNGSAIIIYGQEHGIRILWRGGRSLIPTEEKPQDADAGTNGTNSDAVMIIDSDDEEPAANLIKDKPTFADELNEIDPSEPYLPIVQDLDLNLGTEVLHLSFPNVPSNLQALSADTVPPILSQKIVVAAACSDYSVRLLALPLDPPSHASKDRKGDVGRTRAGSGCWGEDILVIGGNSGHQMIPSCVSLTFTTRHPPRGADTESVGGVRGENMTPRSGSKRRAASRSRSRSRPPGDDKGWDFLLASHSPEISGLLLIFRIPIISDTTNSEINYKISTEHISPFQTQYITSPAMAISFSTSLYPSRRHSQLLLADSKGALKIYQCLSAKSRLALPRRDSDDEESAPEQGSWLISFYTRFENSLTGSGSIVSSHRKQIIDAKWIYGGKAIIVLLSDGEWGVWDTEGVSPAAKKTLLDRDNGQSGIRGGALTAFSLHGWVESSPTSRHAQYNSMSGGSERSRLAPMTPGTRRVREEALFSGPASGVGGSTRGGINVTKSVQSSTAKHVDDSLVLWHDDKIVAIPSLSSYWARETSKSGGSGSLFSSDRQSRIIKVEGINLYGELNCGVDQFPATTPSSKATDWSAISRDLLVTGEHRLIILTTPLSEPERPSVFTQPEKHAPVVDQQLLAAGELDIDGMDRVLASMANGDQRNGDTRNGVAAKRKVGFVSSK